MPIWQESFVHYFLTISWRFENLFCLLITFYSLIQISCSYTKSWAFLMMKTKLILKSIPCHSQYPVKPVSVFWCNRYFKRIWSDIPIFLVCMRSLSEMCKRGIRHGMVMKLCQIIHNKIWLKVTKYDDWSFINKKLRKKKSTRALTKCAREFQVPP